jgi:hypothetical protein
VTHFNHSKYWANRRKFCANGEEIEQAEAIFPRPSRGGGESKRAGKKWAMAAPGAVCKKGNGFFAKTG